MSVGPAVYVQTDSLKSTIITIGKENFYDIIVELYQITSNVPGIVVGRTERRAHRALDGMIVKAQWARLKWIPGESYSSGRIIVGVNMVCNWYSRAKCRFLESFCPTEEAVSS